MCSGLEIDDIVSESAGFSPVPGETPDLDSEVKDPLRFLDFGFKCLCLRVFFDNFVVITVTKPV